MSKRILAACLAVIMMMAVLVGCQSSTGSSQAQSTDAEKTSSTAETTKEDYEIDFMIPNAEDSQSMDNEIGQTIYEKFGIKINVVGYAGDWEEKCAAMLAGGDYPDMLQLQNNVMVQKYIKANALQVLDELAEEYAPNFLEFYADALPYWRAVAEDGKLYKWTAYTPDVEHATTARFDMIIRSDILEQQGWPEVLDEDSYVALLKQGLADNPTTDGNDTLGFVQGAAESWVLGDCMAQLYSKGRYAENGFRNYAYDSVEDKFVDLVQDVPSWKSGWKFWNRLYREGILDPECFTDTDAVAQEKLNSGRALATSYVTWELDAINSALVQAGKEDMQYVTMPIMLKEQIEAEETRVLTLVDVYDYVTTVITKNAEHPERIMELVNWVCTEEGQNLLGWGVEGKHYTVDDDGKKIVTQDYIDCVNGTGDPSFNAGVETYYFLGLSADYDENGQIYAVHYDESIGNLKMSDRLKEVYSHYGWEGVTDPWKKNDSFGYELVSNGIYGAVTLEAGSEAETTLTKVKEFLIKMYPQLIMASSDEEFETIWTDLVEGYKKLNPEIILEYVNEGLETKKAEIEALK